MVRRKKAKRAKKRPGFLGDDLFPWPWSKSKRSKAGPARKKKATKKVARRKNKARKKKKTGSGGR